MSGYSFTEPVVEDPTSAGGDLLQEVCNLTRQCVTAISMVTPPRSLCLAAFLLCLMTLSTGTPAFSEEPVSISDIVTDPDIFHLKQVTIQGVVGRVKEMEPYFLPSGSACYGAYTFLLEDDSANGAILDVAVLGICGAPRVRFPEVADGDRVSVQAEIQVPSRFGQFRGLDGLPIAKGHEPAVQAIAKRISRVGE